MLHQAICPVCRGPLRRLFGFPGGRHVARCRSCGLRRLLPAPSREELAVLYGRKEYFTEDHASLHDDLTADYDRSSAIIGLYRRHLDALTAVRPAPARLLEIGCARGVFLDLARKGGYAVKGVEMNGYAADYGRTRFGLDIAACPFESYDAAGPFDAIVSFDVIEHMSDPAAFVEKVSSLLVPGGVALIGTPDSGSMLARLAEAAVRLTGGRWSYPAWRFYGNGTEHLSIFDRTNLESLLRRSSLEPVVTYGYSIPTINMRDLKGPYRAVIGLLGRLPYELAVLARKR